MAKLTATDLRTVADFVDKLDHAEYDGSRVDVPVGITVQLDERTLDLVLVRDEDTDALGVNFDD